LFLSYFIFQGYVCVANSVQRARRAGGLGQLFPDPGVLGGEGAPPHPASPVPPHPSLPPPSLLGPHRFCQIFPPPECYRHQVRPGGVAHAGGMLRLGRSGRSDGFSRLTAVRCAQRESNLRCGRGRSTLRRGVEVPMAHMQCCGSGMFIPDPDFLPSRILIFFHPGRIQQEQKRGVENFLCCIFCIYKIVNYFIFEKVQTNLSKLTKNFSIFNSKKIVTKLSEIWVWDPGSGKTSS
jgi:hypothetical protein